MKKLDINKLSKDVFSIVKDGGFFTMQSINIKLAEMGWPDDILSEKDVYDIMEILKDTGYDIQMHNVN